MLTQYSCSEIPKDRSLAIVHGLQKSLIELSMQRTRFSFLKYKVDKNETGSKVG